MVSDEGGVVCCAEWVGLGLFHYHCLEFCLVLDEGQFTRAQRGGKDVPDIAKFYFGHVDRMGDIHSACVRAHGEFEKAFDVP